MRARGERCEGTEKECSSSFSSSSLVIVIERFEREWSLGGEESGLQLIQESCFLYETLLRFLVFKLYGLLFVSFSYVNIHYVMDYFCFKQKVNNLSLLFQLKTCVQLLCMPLLLCLHALLQEQLGDWYFESVEDIWWALDDMNLGKGTLYVDSKVMKLIYNQLKFWIREQSIEMLCKYDIQVSWI